MSLLCASLWTQCGDGCKLSGFIYTLNASLIPDTTETFIPQLRISRAQIDFGMPPVYSLPISMEHPSISSLK